jgi:hypothetical protein
MVNKRIHATAADRERISMRKRYALWCKKHEIPSRFALIGPMLAGAIVSGIYLPTGHEQISRREITNAVDSALTACIPARKRKVECLRRAGRIPNEHDRNSAKAACGEMADAECKVALLSGASAPKPDDMDNLTVKKTKLFGLPVLTELDKTEGSLITSVEKSAKVTNVIARAVNAFCGIIYGGFIAGIVGIVLFYIKTRITWQKENETDKKAPS